MLYFFKLEYCHTVMDILRDIIETVMRQNEDSTNQNEDNVETVLTLDDDESVIEREIVKCQAKHGRLLISTSTALRKKYGHWSPFGYYVCDKTDRCIRKLAKRRQRGKNEAKIQQEQLGKTLKPIVDYIFKQQDNRQGI